MFGHMDEFTPEPYKAYKNRTFARHHKRTIDTIRQIKDCSLKAEDKLKLKKELIKLLEQ